MSQNQRQAVAPIVVGILGGIALFVFSSFVNFCIGLMFITGLQESRCQFNRTNVTIGEIFELLMVAAAAFIAYQAIVGGRPFRQLSIGWRVAWLTLALLNLVPWPCSVSGTTVALGHMLLLHCPGS